MFFIFVRFSDLVFFTKKILFTDLDIFYQLHYALSNSKQIAMTILTKS